VKGHIGVVLLAVNYLSRQADAFLNFAYIFFR